MWQLEKMALIVNEEMAEREREIGKVALGVIILVRGKMVLLKGSQGQGYLSPHQMLTPGTGKQLP